MDEIEASGVHISKGCLSDIPPKCGTNKNEALHRSIRPLFHRCRMGLPLALALMISVLYFYNNKQAREKCPRGGNLGQSILSGWASYKKGVALPLHRSIWNSQQDRNITWIFGHQKVCIEEFDLTHHPVEIEVSKDLEQLASVDDIRRILQKAYNMYLVAKELQKTSKFSSVTSGAHKMIPFMSSISCLFNTDQSSADHESQQERLCYITKSWGFELQQVTTASQHWHIVYNSSNNS